VVRYNIGPALRAVIFDFDGLIVDTEGPAYRSWQEIYAEFGCTLPLSIWERVLGGFTSVPFICEYLETLLGRPIEREAILARRQARKLELTAAEPVLPGVLDYISAAKTMRVRLGLASSSSRRWVTDNLAQRGLANVFDCLCCREDVQHVKPAPDLYVAALAGLGAGSEDAIALEDSPNGITAAKRAGLFCVAVPNKLTARLSLDRADMALPSLDAMPLAELLQFAAHAPRRTLAAMSD
jgi:HAD superfamily hydrolase (TIGR01509 family)